MSDDEYSDGDDDEEVEYEEEGEEDEEDGGEGEEEEEEEEDSAAVASDRSSRLRRRRKGFKALLLTKYDSVWQTTKLLGWKAFSGDDAPGKGRCNLCWTDRAVTSSRIMRMGRLQKINHFPGMFELVKKTGTARNLNKMLGACGKAYKFFPTTYTLPADYSALKLEWSHGRNHGNKTFIVKPSSGCQGNGIRLTRNLDDIDPQEPNIVQRYMHRPHLLDGFKYDLRLYVLLSSVRPLRCFLFREGLVRVCTQKCAPLPFAFAPSAHVPPPFSHTPPPPCLPPSLAHAHATPLHIPLHIPLHLPLHLPLHSPAERLPSRPLSRRYAPLEKNMGDVRMHLTNYSINKDSEAFVQPEDENDCADAHKRTVSSLMETLEEEGHDTEALWQRIGEVCVKTIISTQPHLEHTYFTCRGRTEDAGSGCFELLGFDIMMDHKLRPSLLEVNHTPSFRCDSPLDATVKMAVLRGTMEMINTTTDEWRLLRLPKPKLSSRLETQAASEELVARLVALREEYELGNANRLGFDTLYPPNAATCGGDESAAVALKDEYDRFLAISAALFCDMSLSGSRRQSNSCSTNGPKSKASSPTKAGSRGGFHASAAAAVFKAGLKSAEKAGLKAGLKGLRVDDIAPTLQRAASSASSSASSASASSASTSSASSSSASTSSASAAPPAASPSPPPPRCSASRSFFPRVA